ncbi:hypothetical protein WISP_135088 [Willisornis vidua]|uniref:Uncharacterized protein n=1 Tax=Willisornis vidua TaxID=1566151 RepID=A0ABQ9CU58_9PASS|nr:hypothetical protein WISP_135088 [Willisornis vidua]
MSKENQSHFLPFFRDLQIASQKNSPLAFLVAAKGTAVEILSNVDSSLPCMLTSARREQQLYIQDHGFMSAVAKRQPKDLKKGEQKDMLYLCAMEMTD